MRNFIHTRKSKASMISGTKLFQVHTVFCNIYMFMAFSKSFSLTVLMSTWHSMHKDAQLFCHIYKSWEKSTPYVQHWHLKKFHMHHSVWWAHTGSFTKSSVHHQVWSDKGIIYTIINKMFTILIDERKTCWFCYINTPTLACVCKLKGDR